MLACRLTATHAAADDVVNGNYTLPNAAPQLLRQVDDMQPMLDEPNDMWAAATVLFQLLMSGHLEWEKRHGPFMFGPSDQDMIAAFKLPDEMESAELYRSKIEAEQRIWVGA